MKRLPLLLFPLFLFVLLGGCTTDSLGKLRNAMSGSGSSAGSSQLPVKSFAEILSEAQRGDPEQMFNLGMIYLEGFGTGSGTIQKDITKARQWLEQSANSGYPKALFNLGVMYYQGTDGVRQNLATARKWFTEAAKQNDQLGHFNLGVMWYRGEGGPKSFEKARQSFEAASVLGYAEGAYNIGVMYAKGEGVKRDTLEAIAWFKVAEAQGSLKAGQIAKDLQDKLSPEDRKKASDRTVALAKEIEEKAHAEP